MKKIFVCAIALMALMFANCGNKQNGSAENADSTATDTVAVVSEGAVGEAETLLTDLKEKLNSQDANGLEQVITSAKQKIDELVKAGKVEEAKAYAAKVKTFIDENAESIKQVAGGNSTISSIVNTISALPTDAESAVSSVGESVKSDAEKAVQSAKEEAETKATEAKESVKKKATDAVDNAANKALNKLGL